ncbi:hypothetical protein DFH06DRAFT_1478800 [Mycena polygramma]|nr:hypothetical protein DFH06DRAFT_1478800 [Mycena polygramma]
MPPRRKPLRRAHSSTTHVSDSEPEREAFRTNLIGACSSTSSFNSSAPDTPPTERPPLSSLSNTVPDNEPMTSRAIHERLSAMEGVLWSFPHSGVTNEGHLKGQHPLPPPPRNACVPCRTSAWATSRLSASEQKSAAACLRNFNMRLREYIAGHHPSHPVRLEQEIKIKGCKVVYLDYQSKVDWRSARDILRCNPKFHNAPRYDSVIYETNDDPLAMGQLQFMFRALLPSGAELDLAMIRPFRKTSWQPKTPTDCPVREPLSPQSSLFIALEHVQRGALLCPIFGGKQGMHYIIDCVDDDMYLRVNNID